jgi:S-DNA-T family DNA segregation ATPase FtsK/SpoIIIE
VKVPSPKKYKAPYIVGIDRKTGKPFIYDIVKAGHTLLAGMTGSGKSSLLHSIIRSMMYWSDDIFFYMVDLKGNELPDAYGNFNNCCVAGLADGDTLDDSIRIIKDVFLKVDKEYHKRIKLFKKHGVKDIANYNKKIGKLPYVVFVVDEANAIFEIIKDDKNYKDTFEIIRRVTNNLFARGRSTGMYNVHGMQQIRENEYNISWRRAMMSRMCMLMKEPMQCKLALGCDTVLADKASKQMIGEFILIDCHNQIHDLQNVRVDTRLEEEGIQDETYKELVEIYGRDSYNVNLEKDAK